MAVSGASPMTKRVSRIYHVMSRGLVTYLKQSICVPVLPWYSVPTGALLPRMPRSDWKFGKLQWCSKVSCGREDAHRTRRLNAAGEPDCTAAHGNTGKPARGCCKSRSAKNADRPLVDAVPDIGKHARVSGVRVRTKAKPTRQLQPMCARFSTPHGKSTAPLLPRSQACESPLPPGPVSAFASAAPRPDVVTLNPPSTARSIEDFLDAIIANPVLDKCFSRADKIFVHASAIRIYEKCFHRSKRPQTSCTFTPVASQPFNRYLTALAIFRIAVDLAEIDKHTKTDHSGETVEISVDDVCKEVEPSTETRKLAWAKQPAILNVIYQSGGLKRPPITEGASE